MNKTLEHLKETLEDEIKGIIKKGDMTPAELESVQKALTSSGVRNDPDARTSIISRRMPQLANYNASWFRSARR